ncbi:ACT domain-containing protein [Ferruginibacter sp.]|jgi:hypothetical protein|uniref:ACT domain-containing protein n=1 Tax=Ferruginibacter sp. TaxID=1940288 RepID=UPI00265A78A9|nr:ACT domain-containing protein [Ferruginibacter sp.]
MKTAEKSLDILLKTMQPIHNPGEFVFCTCKELTAINSLDVISIFKEQEGYTVILKKDKADQLLLSYSFIASWITLKVHSSLEAVGFTAAFSNVLASAGISCNVVAACYHDHIFVKSADTKKAMDLLNSFSEIQTK